MIPAGQDVAAAIAFYEEQLGFRTLYTEGNPITLAIVRRDTAELFLYQNDDPHLAEWTSFRIQVEGIEQLYEEFQSKGGAMLDPSGELQVQPWGAKEFAILDLAGVCITFYEPIELAKF
jgi:catechol 2,3-dioxygenase-like lactoylglutathione lyase family enzyme